MKVRLNRLLFPNDQHPNHVKALDGLRAFAVLLVLFSHWNIENPGFHPLFDLRGAGKGGVMLFFVLSAYLLDRQIVLAFQNQRANTRYWLNYTLRRFLRIIPLYALVLCLYRLFHSYGYAGGISSWNGVMEHLLLQRGDGVFWSIPVEFKYYLISPILLWVAHRAFQWKFPAMHWFLGGLGLVALAVSVSFLWPPISTLRYLPIFLLGTAAAIYHLAYPKVLERKLSLQKTTLVTLCTLILAYLILPQTLNEVLGIKVKGHNAVTFSIWAVIGARLLLVLHYRQDIFHWLLTRKLVRHIGNVSFSLYLLHMPVLIWVNQAEAIPAYLKLAAFLTLSLVAATVSYLFVEFPLSRIRLVQPGGLSEYPKKDAPVHKNL